jgi:hypothetical protein
LWSSGDATLVNEDGKKVAKMSSKVVNQATGRESNKAIAFGDANWGTRTQRYLALLDDFRDTSIEKLIQKAQKLVKSSAGSTSQTAASESNVKITDGKRLIRDLSDDESS